MEDILPLIRNARRRLLTMHYESGVGHIGGNLSSLDILMVLHHWVLGPDDVFILSKGHAAGALYVTLWSRGVLSESDLKQFHGERTRLSAHPAPGWVPEIPFATGSLGHGMSLAIGVALGKYLQGKPGRVFCIVSDGELQEGSFWESIIFANRHLTSPLTIFIDANGLQGFGSTQEVAALDLTPSKFKEFGITTREIDGHDPSSILSCCERNEPGTQIIIARTHKGRGVEFMEDRMEWHYLPMSLEQYQLAIAGLDNT